MTITHVQEPWYHLGRVTVFEEAKAVEVRCSCGWSAFHSDVVVNVGIEADPVLDDFAVHGHDGRPHMLVPVTKHYNGDTMLYAPELDDRAHMKPPPDGQNRAQSEG